MAVVDELVTILGAEVSPGSQEALKKFGAGISSIKSQLAIMGTVAIGALTAAGLFVKSVSDEAEALDKLSKQTGISTDTLQEFDYAAQQVGVSAEAVKNDIIGLQKSMASPIPGQFNAELAMLGVNAKKSNGELKSTDELLLDMSDKFKDMSAQEASQWASKVGVSEDTLLLLRKGREGIEELKKEAHDLGGIIPEDSIKTAAKFKKDLAELKFALKGIGSQIAIATIPAMSKLVDGFKNFITANREFLSLSLESVMGGLVGGFERFFGLLKSVAEKFQPLIDKVGEFLPQMEGVEFVTHLVTGALTGLLVLLAPIIAKFALVGAAIAGASLVLEDFFTYLEGGESLTGKVIDAIKAKFEGFVNRFKKKFPALYDMLSFFGEGIKNFLGGAFDYALERVKAFFEFAKKAIESVLGGIGEAVDSIAGFGNDVAEFFGFGGEETASANLQATPQNMALAPASSHSNSYNSTKGDTIINLQLSTNDPSQVADYLQRNIAADQVNTNTPGGYAPTGM